MRFLNLSLLILFVATPVAFGQGLRIETQISDMSTPDNSGQGRLLSSSLSLFHNGRVYDYVESADEVIIYERNARRFTLMNPARGLLTTVTFDEIRHLLASRQPMTERYIAELAQSNSPESKKIARSLQFQMNPDFDVDFDSPRGHLRLQSPSWRYNVATQEWTDQDQLQAYLTYCDWTAKLNHILHPSGLSPEPRMLLNAELRKLTNRIPVSVELDLRPDERLTLQASHRFVQDLDDIDRSLIRRWDDAVAGNTLRKVSFRRYQESTLVSQVR